MNNQETITAATQELFYRYTAPPNREAKVILLTTGKVATLGPWGSGLGVIAWCPLPKRDKQLEEKLGL